MKSHRLRTSLAGDVMSKLGALKNAVAKIVTPEDLKLSPFKPDSPGYTTVVADFKSFAIAVADLDGVGEQLEKIGGKQLSLQVSVLRCMGTCVLAGMAAAELDSHFGSESETLDSLSSPNNRSIPVLKILNSEISKIGFLLADRGASAAERWDTCFLPPTVPDANHINMLDGIVQSVFVMKDLQSSLCGLRDKITFAFINTAKYLTSKLDSCCPLWKCHVDKLFEMPDLIKALTANPHHGLIGPLVECARTYLCYLRALRKQAGAIFPYDVAKTLKASIANGCDTCCLSWILFSIESDLILLPNLAIRKAKIETLRQQVVSKDFIIPEAVAIVLDTMATDVHYPGKSFTLPLPGPVAAPAADLPQVDSDGDLATPADLLRAAAPDDDDPAASPEPADVAIPLWDE